MSPFWSRIVTEERGLKASITCLFPHKVGEDFVDNVLHGSVRPGGESMSASDVGEGVVVGATEPQGASILSGRGTAEIIACRQECEGSREPTVSCPLASSRG